MPDRVSPYSFVIPTSLDPSFVSLTGRGKSYTREVSQSGTNIAGKTDSLIEIWFGKRKGLVIDIFFRSNLGYFFARTTIVVFGEESK